MQLAILVLTLATATQMRLDDGNRAIMFATQDVNGLHMVSTFSWESKTRAAVRTFSKTSRGEPKDVDYPPQRFDDAWQKLKGREFERYRTAGQGDAESAYNYVFVLTDSNTHLNFRIPKCGIDDETLRFVRGFTQELLPEGSPGLFEPCPTQP